MSVAPGATVGGNVTIKEGAIVCMGATILGKCTIGKHALVGAGALVNKDVPAYTVVYGVPAEAIRLRQEDAPYL